MNNDNLSTTRVAITRDVRGFRADLSVFIWKRLGDGSVVTFEPVVLMRRTREELEAYQIGAPKSRHVSIHPNCLHWWVPMDGPVLPDFSSGGIAI